MKRNHLREWPPKTDKECYLKIQKGFEKKYEKNRS